MAYLVKIMPRARRDLADIYTAIDAERSDAASRWFDGLERAVLTRRKAPLAARSRPRIRVPIYRVIYRIRERKQEVEILHIRHDAMDRFKPEDL